MKHILIINGPNLNLLGKREPILYGSETFDEVVEELRKKFPKVKISHTQSNSESDLIEAVQHADASDVEGIVLNPAAYTHTSLALADAVAAVAAPTVEVHITNIFARESFRHKSHVSRYAAGVISGFGVAGYHLAVAFLSDFRE